MSLILPRPSFAGGFARSQSESAFPHLWEGLVGAWVPSLGPQGTELLRDFSNCGHHGTLQGAIPGSAWIAGENGWRLDFDGTNDYVRIPHTDRLNLTGRLSIVTRFQYTDTGTWQCQVTKPAFDGAHSSPFFNFLLGASSTDQARLYLARSAGGTVDLRIGALSNGQTYSLAGTVEAPGTARLYIDGAERSSGAVSSTLRSSTSPIHIGAHATGGERHQGPLEYVFIWDRVLTAEEVMQLHRGASPLTLRRRTVAKAAGSSLAINLGFVATGEQLFAPAVRTKIQLDAIGTGEQVFTPSVRQSLSLGFVSSGEQVFAPAVRQNISLTNIASGEQIFGVSVALEDEDGSQTVNLAFIPSDEDIFAPAVTQRVSLSAIASGERVLSVTVFNGERVISDSPIAWHLRSNEMGARFGTVMPLSANWRVDPIEASF